VKKLMLLTFLMLPLAISTPVGGVNFIPIEDPCALGDCIEEVPLPPPSVPSCYPVCN